MVVILMIMHCTIMPFMYMRNELCVMMIRVIQISAKLIMPKYIIPFNIMRSNSEPRNTYYKINTNLLNNVLYFYKS